MMVSDFTIGKEDELASAAKKTVRFCAKCVAGLILFSAFLAVCYALLCRVHSHRSAWMQAAPDSNGIALWGDPDADGDRLSMSEDRDANNDGIPNEEQAASYARSMLRIPYDPLMGKYNDFLGKAGFVVCIDVPLRSYLWAGVSMPALLKRSAKEHPEWFKIGPDNSPGNPFFYRRVRNYYYLFMSHLELVHDQTPKPGDWAFYGRTHIALVISVEKDGWFEVIEASPKRGRVVISTSDYMEKTWGRPDFFGRIKYK